MSRLRIRALGRFQWSFDGNQPINGWRAGGDTGYFRMRTLDRTLSGGRSCRYSLVEVIAVRPALDLAWSAGSDITVGRAGRSSDFHRGLTQPRSSPLADHRGSLRTIVLVGCGSDVSAIPS